MKRSYVCGSEKRKRVKDKEDERKKHKKISSFFTHTHISDTGNREAPNSSQNNEMDVNITLSAPETSSSSIQEEATTHLIPKNVETNDCKEEENNEDIVLEDDEFEDLPISSDIALFQNDLTDSIKHKILKLGPCQPEGQFPKDACNRSFSAEYYHIVTKTGQKLRR